MVPLFHFIWRIAPISMTLGKLNAMLGLLAAAAVSYYIISRVHEASAPLATRARVSNFSSAALSVGELRIAGHLAGATSASLPPRTGQAQGGAAFWESTPVDLAPGRAVDLAMTLAGERAIVVPCTLPVRPPGACVIQANYYGATDLRCDYLCEGDINAE